MTAPLPPATRDGLHALVDALPDTDLAVAQHLLASLDNLDPALRTALLAPVDDEPFTDEDRQAVESARAAHRRGEWVSSDDIRREIGW